jgi:NAD(P)-dependent dehydrogenase (short-subunit alcohol dehydrogenase family)
MVSRLCDYEGKRSVVVGGASGIGAAVVDLVLDLGSEVVVLDVKQTTDDRIQSLHVDLASQSSIDGALDACGGPIDALFACAGVAEGTPGIERINFIAHRHIIDRARRHDLFRRGSAIGIISSEAGLGWERNLAELHSYLDTETFDEAVEWIASRPGYASYIWSKKAINAYVAREACSLLTEGIRINSILPGPTETPLALADPEVWLGFGTDYRESVGIEVSTPVEQASVLAFLCSDAASYVNGVTLVTDAGYFSSGLTGSFPPAVPVIDYFLHQS